MSLFLNMNNSVSSLISYINCKHVSNGRRVNAIRSFVRSLELLTNSWIWSFWSEALVSERLMGDVCCWMLWTMNDYPLPILHFTFISNGNISTSLLINPLNFGLWIVNDILILWLWKWLWNIVVDYIIYMYNSAFSILKTSSCVSVARC